MKALLIGAVMLTAGAAAFGQEIDDLYYNAKDRAKEKALARKEAAERDLRMNEESRKSLSINPTDSYSSRNINPEYTSRQQNSSNEEDEDVGYFQSNYQPTGVNQSLYNNNFYNNSYSAWNNPYYGYAGGFGSPYSSFWGSPYSYYGGTGWSISMGYGFGYPSYGWGWNNWGSPSSMFWNNYYGYGYGYGFNNYYSPWGWNNWGWGNPYYGGYYGGYSPVVVVDNGNHPKMVYGRRSDRSSSLNNVVDNSRPINSVTRSGREISSGRTRQDNTPTYYDRSWRDNQNQNTTTRSYWGTESGTRTYSGTRSTPNAGRQSSWNNGGNDNNNSFWNNGNNSTPSRSWSGDNGSSFSGGGSRSHSSGTSSHSSGGGGSRTRGRD